MYFAIGIYQPKTESNIGTLYRSAHNFGAKYIFTIGRRYKPQCSDTTKAWRQIPLFEYSDWDAFLACRPKEAQLVFIEQTQDAKNLKNFTHPKQALYLLGSEGNGIPSKIMAGHTKVYIDTPMCLNVATAGSITMYDRSVKLPHKSHN